MFTFLNISGTPFQTNEDTLKTIPLFEAYFANIQSPRGQTPNEPLFVDRDSGMFESIYMRMSFPMAAESKTSKTLSGEMLYYGLVPAQDEDEPEGENEKVEDELEVLMGTTEPLYVNACGRIFTTCKIRLSKMDYFRRMFEGGWKENSDTVGTKSNPMFLDIPPKAFESILAFIRNSAFAIPEQYNMIANVYGIKTEQPPLIAKVTPIEPVIGTAARTSYGGTGGLLQLVTNDTVKGAKWSVFEKRTTPKFSNIARDHIDLHTHSNPGWGKIHEIIVTRNGDMACSPYLMINIGDLNRHVSWSPHLEFRIIKKVTVILGGQEVDQMTGQQILMEEMLFDNVKGPDCPSDTSLVIPLRTFFKKMEDAIPLVALPHSEVKIRVELSEFNNCVDDIPEGLEIPEIDSMFIRMAYFYLDTDERRHTATNPREKLVHQRRTFDIFVPPDTTTANLDLGSLKLPLEMIGFTLHNDASDLFDCSDALLNAKMVINGHDRFAHDGYHLKVLDKIDSNMNSTNIPIYTYSFCPDMKLSIHKGQSISSMNCSNLQMSTMTFNFKKGVQRISVWTIERNVLIIKDGYSGLAFR